MIRTITLLLALSSVGFHLYLIFSGLLSNLLSRPLHLALALPWVFLFRDGDSPKQRILGALWCGAGLWACGYIVWWRDSLGDQYGYLEGPDQYLLAVILILTVMEMARRAIKLALPLVALLALAYGMLGQYLPGEFGHPGIPVASLLGNLTIAEAGIWGPLAGVSVNVVAVFIMLGSMVGAGEGGTGFMALATRLAGRYRAGAAKVSVLASALFGSISGSASANVASTGSVTLPTMKRLGYPAHFAAAVEAVASSGGQIMPPLMGAGAFVMVELLQLDYGRIMLAALLPAVLFFWAVWAGVDHYARRHGLQGMAPEELPSWAEVRGTAPFFLLPFGVLLGMLFFSDYTPQYAAGIAILMAMALLITDRRWQLEPAAGWQRLLAGAEDAARHIATIASIILCAGIIIGVLNLTGLGVKLTSLIIGFSGGELWPALLLTALACLVLGMEVPTTAAYIICVSVAGPALQNLGMEPLHAHLFVFWYALLSTITPPVCGTVFIAAGMADAPWLKVADRAMRLGLGLYLVPLGFVANPALICPHEMPLAALIALLKVGSGLWLVSLALMAREWRWFSRLGGLAGGALLIFLALPGS